MGATLDALHQLQCIETRLRSLREQIDAKQRTVRARNRRLASLEREINDTHEQMRRAQTEADRLELQRKTHEDHIAKLREALNQARTNKEYAAVLTQLNTDKADATKVEDQVLVALGRVDDLKAALARHQATFQVERERLAGLEQQAGELESQLAGQLDDLGRQREAAADAVPPQVLQLFERACDKHDGEAMAMIERTHPKRGDYTCSGCNMSVTLQTINALQSSGDEVQICETCSRILYLDAPSSVVAG